MNSIKRATFSGVAVLLAAAFGTTARAGGRAVVASCVTNSDTAAIAIVDVRQSLTFGDSAAIASAGMPYKPSTVQLVTNNATCDSVIAAFNDLFTPAESTKKVQQALIIQAGSAYALRSNGPPVAYVYFDSLFTLRFSLTMIE